MCQILHTFCVNHNQDTCPCSVACGTSGPTLQQWRFTVQVAVCGTRVSPVQTQIVALPVIYILQYIISHHSDGYGRNEWRDIHVL